MINIEYANAYSEVLEILKYISQEDYNKIPKEQIRLFEKNANLQHNFSYNPLKTLEEQNVLRITKGIIAILFIDYWSTDIQRDKIIAKQKYNMMKLEEEKREKYNPDNIFNIDNSNVRIDNIENIQGTEISDISNMKWYKKIYICLRNLLRK